jgi:predicted acyltransferase
MLQQRNESLDALRGYAILTMILSGSIAFGDTLPAWMYHAQVPPPHHKFTESISGITWVDLVFPFFIFSMGAAIPLALQKQVQQGSGFLPILLIAARRLALLAFFALFTEHLKAWVMEETPVATTYLLSIIAFVLLCFQFYENRQAKYVLLFRVLKIAAFVIALALLYLLSFRGGRFTFTKSDIIIMVLANMAFFGTMIWWLTRNHTWVRVGILPFIMAVFLAAKEPQAGWAKTLFEFSHIGTVDMSWLYKFYFLKYLFILIPGTMAGDWFLKYGRSTSPVNSAVARKIGLLALALVVNNTVFLFTRQLVLNLAVTVLLIGLIYYLLKKEGREKLPLYYHFFLAGAYLLLLGLFFEAYEGGIRKDRSTYSYYFVTAGLAFFMLLFFQGLAALKAGAAITRYLSLNGRNPMVAYVAGSLLLTPLLHLTGAIALFEKMNANAGLGFLKGVLFTGIVSLITLFFTKRGWFWKT